MRVCRLWPRRSGLPPVAGAPTGAGLATIRLLPLVVAVVGALRLTLVVATLLPAIRLLPSIRLRVLRRLLRSRPSPRCVGGLGV